ncbi:MAG: LamG-like jellyroll fold domain-containing protein [Solirubrobacterales bacterium]
MLRQSVLVMLCVLIWGPAWSASGALVGWWAFDETEGTVARDSSGHGNDGTVVGAPVWVQGRIDGALQFDGSTYVNCGNSQVFNITNEVTLAAWIQPDPDFAYPDWSGIIMRGGANIDTFALYYNGPAKQMGFKTTGTTPNWFASAANSAAAMFDREWHHVAATYDGATKIIYLDGAPLANAASTGRIETSSGRLLLGAGRDLTPVTHHAAGLLDDAQIYDEALAQAQIQKIMEGLSDRSLAREPTPPDGTLNVPPDVLLGWKPGNFAVAHDVYFGAVFDDVNDAGRSDPRGVLVGQDQTIAQYDPQGPLEYGKTYYWRIDEVNAAPDSTIFKGMTWSFTVEPYGYPITNVTATASSFQPGMGPENTINGSGLDDLDQHSTESTQMWMSEAKSPIWIQYEFDKVYKLHELWVWNSNQMVESFVGFGAKSVTIEYSTDQATWTTLEGVPEFSRATGSPVYTANTTVEFGGVMARYVRLTINSNWGGVAAQSGLAEVRFFYAPIQAYQPDPADAVAGVVIGSELTWRSGRGATSHVVYFGTDSGAVADGTAASKAVTEAGYTPAAMTLGTAYYWRVDEVGDAGTVAGDVWSFTSQEYAPIDDFEAYNDDDNRIYAIWVDGVTNKASGSQVGYSESPFAERAVVHGGDQSMPLLYDNTASPYYSEAERTFDTAQNWTTYGADSLCVYFRGLAANSAEGLYLTVKDTSGKSKTVAFSNAAATQTTEWQQWKIPLSEFTSAGVKATAVESLVIGVGNRASPVAGGAGTVYVDDLGFGHPLP